ncbi:aminomethyltransferase, mitochondrial [Schistocerca nitens]|uniref:aminomethyltransferase, mitochondrial n=1 Tax=Schistocerca nitens TaxID=7011 RepID=UPI002118B690|nr:aminomethyltransferase, mitochondrial [Schistocerca nitens]
MPSAVRWALLHRQVSALSAPAAASGAAPARRRFCIITPTPPLPRAPPPPRPTALLDLHRSLGARLVDFAGYLLPVSYRDHPDPAAHLHTRRHCSLFDVSHMMQTEVRGRDRVALVERLTPADVQSLPDNAATLSVFTHPHTGGVLDDLVVTKTALGYLHLVSNAARRHHDQQLLRDAEAELRAAGLDVEVRFLEPSEMSLLALQGPESAAALQPCVDVDLSALGFMRSTLATVCGVPRVRVTRCGYTGEDGFELSVPSASATQVAQKLLASRKVPVRPAGLGARDSLRLEAGLCLYGSDLDETTTPVEAGLSWLIAKKRRASADFPGAGVILEQLRSGPRRRRVGLRWEAGPPARAGAAVVAALSDAAPAQVGRVTSGCPSPSLGGSVALAYVDSQYSRPGTSLAVQVRGRDVPVEVCRLPFVPHRFYKKDQQ